MAAIKPRLINKQTFAIARRSRTVAFTLIELCVVCAIISIVAAMIFPVVSAAVRRAKASACASQLRQLAGFFVIYAQDNSGFLPIHTNREWMIHIFEPGYDDAPWPSDSDEPRLMRESMDAYVTDKSLWFTAEDPVAKQPIYYLGIMHQYSSFVYGQPSRGGWAPWPMMVNLNDLTPNMEFIGDPIGCRGPRDSAVWFVPNESCVSYHNYHNKTSHTICSDLHLKIMTADPVPWDQIGQPPD